MKILTPVLHTSTLQWWNHFLWLIFHFLSMCNLCILGERNQVLWSGWERWKESTPIQRDPSWDFLLVWHYHHWWLYPFLMVGKQASRKQCLHACIALKNKTVCSNTAWWTSYEKKCTDNRFRTWQWCTQRLHGCVAFHAWRRWDWNTF